MVPLSLHYRSICCTVDKNVHSVHWRLARFTMVPLEALTLHTWLASHGTAYFYSLPFRGYSFVLVPKKFKWSVCVVYSRYSSFDETNYLFLSRRSALNFTYVYRFLSLPSPQNIWSLKESWKLLSLLVQFISFLDTFIT